jgi:Glucose / Sorbosone dehydrogenase
MLHRSIHFEPKPFLVDRSALFAFYQKLGEIIIARQAANMGYEYSFAAKYHPVIVTVVASFAAFGLCSANKYLLTELRLRIRDVRQGPDGLLYLLTEEEEGALLRIEPAPQGKP